jgi:hypothetical protein
MLQFVEFGKSFKEKHGFKNDEEVAKDMLSKAIIFLNEKVGKSCYEGIDDIITEFDLTKAYIVNWACIFNNPSLVGNECQILAKDSKIAIVAFADNTINTYRLEDLDCINY